MRAFCTSFTAFFILLSVGAVTIPTQAMARGTASNSAGLADAFSAFSLVSEAFSKKVDFIGASVLEFFDTTQGSLAQVGSTIESREVGQQASVAELATDRMVRVAEETALGVYLTIDEVLRGKSVE